MGNGRHHLYILCLPSSLFSKTSQRGKLSLSLISIDSLFLFLKLSFSQGLLTTNLRLLRHITPQPAWLYTQKLPRLLELGASFLDSIAPNSHHPARSQAQVLRTLIDTGVKGRIPTPMMTAGEIPPTLVSGSGGPSNASTVMTSKIPPPPPILSPAPTLSSLAPTQSIQPQSQIYPSQQQVQQVQFPNLPTPTTTNLQQQQPWANNNNHATTSASSSSPQLIQQQQSQGFVPGMDQALQNVLSDFEPLFGIESGQNFWDYGNNSSGGSGASVTTPQGGATYPTGTTPTNSGGGGIDWSEYLRYSNRVPF